MEPSVIAALVAAQAPEHAQCRAQELVEFDGIDSTVTVQCACNVQLKLTVPMAAANEPARPEGDRDGS